ncbi:MAG TPA: hypothetical protein VIU12_07225 [Chryseolinea sp.]
METGHVHKAISMVVAAQKAASKDGRGLKGGRPPTPLEVVVEALFYRLRNAGPWRAWPL